MNVILSDEYRFVEYYLSSKIPLVMIQNKYVHKSSSIGKMIRIEEDFQLQSNQKHNIKLMKTIINETKISGVLFKYNNIQYRFMLPRRYPFEGPDDFDTNYMEKVYSNIPNRLYKRYLEYYKIKTNSDTPKVNNWTEHTTLKQVVDQYILLKSNIIKVEKIRLFKKFLQIAKQSKQSYCISIDLELLIYEYI